MRRKRKVIAEEYSAIDMSPLIDCVFLLLIFFLVTTVIKRKEKLLPAKIPVQTAALDKKTDDKTIILAIDKNSTVYKFINRKGPDGSAKFTQIENVSKYIKKMHSNAINNPIRIECERKVPFQTVIDTIDSCKLNGFSSVSVRIREKINK
jgi:biopolymer transport protein ExbD